MEYDSGNEFYPLPRKKPHAGNGYEIYRTKKRLVMKEEYRKLFNNSTTLYQFLLSNIVRGDMLGDKFDIKKKHYDKGFLACSFSLRELSKHCFISFRKIRNYIDMLSKAGIIKIEKAPIRDKKEAQNIYVLGTWQFIEGVKDERLYMDDVFDV